MRQIFRQVQIPCPISFCKDRFQDRDQFQHTGQCSGAFDGIDRGFGASARGYTVSILAYKLWELLTETMLHNMQAKVVVLTCLIILDAFHAGVS